MPRMRRPRATTVSAPMTTASGKVSAALLGLHHGRGDGELERVLLGDRGFVDAGREDAELRRDAGHELAAPGRGRSQDDLHAAYCTRIGTVCHLGLRVGRTLSGARRSGSR
ncbi:MAG: hypothetical protein MZV64_43590 [Ignavibacteriales bacterium]|nr:hypothetical protein [Ignavibacteriales bacterium]